MTISSSFRDPSGSVYWEGDKLRRRIAPDYVDTHRRFMKLGLYDRLVARDLLIPHIELEDTGIIEPEVIPFISYPYEWCFSTYKDAALTTLDIAITALEYGMILKDASAYNIQFRKGRPVLIDTLSFEEYQKGKPWGAYRQFCQHFLAPLALMGKRDVRLGQLMKSYIDGIPLDLASLLLPKLGIDFGLNVHIHAQATAQKRIARARSIPMREIALRGLLENLRKTIERLKWHGHGDWTGYKLETSYSVEAVAAKKKIIVDYLGIAQPKTVWDLGANTGEYSTLAADAEASVVAFDSDPSCVEACYHNHRHRLLPLVVDLTNPSPAIGWANRERMSLSDRGPVELVMTLALVHHLAIGNNTPLPMIAEWFSSLGEWLIIEFVPKEDEQVQKMLSGRVDIFHQYTRDDFEAAFGEYYQLVVRKGIPQSCRSIYLFRAR